MYSSYKDQAYTFDDHNVFNFGISNLNESALHFCDSAVSDEKSNTKLFTFSQNTDVLTSNPSNSTALGSRDNEIETPQLCHTPSDWEKDIYEFLTVSESSQPKVDIGFSQEYMPVKSERTAVYDAHVLSTTVSTISPVETGDDTPKSESSEGSEYNVNGHSMEVETVTKTKPDQSKYKNKLKELFEKALKMYNEIKNMTLEEFVKILRESGKSDEEWAFEGANLEESLRMFEMMTCNGNKKEAAKIKKTILRELEAKQYCCIAELYNFKTEILELESDVIQNFNKNYKSKVSHAFFKKSEFDSEDLFSWMLLAQIALALIPEDQEYVELLPLKKSTVCLGTWLLDSPMKQENKDLYKDSTVRNHLREVMTEVYSNLMSQATEKMDHGRLALLQRVSEGLGTNFAPMQRSPRRVVRVARARASPQYNEIECDMTGKRGSNRAPVLSENKTIKKVNKQRK